MLHTAFKKTISYHISHHQLLSSFLGTSLISQTFFDFYSATETMGFSPGNGLNS